VQRRYSYVCQHNISNRSKLRRLRIFCLCQDLGVYEFKNWTHTTQFSICFTSGHDFSTSFLIWEKEKLKAYEVLEFIFIGWEGKKPSVVRYEIRCRRLESTLREIRFVFFPLFTGNISKVPHWTQRCTVWRHIIKLVSYVLRHGHVVTYHLHLGERWRPKYVLGWKADMCDMKT
jgi:hypothetical protein